MYVLVLCLFATVLAECPFPSQAFGACVHTNCDAPNSEFFSPCPKGQECCRNACGGKTCVESCPASNCLVDPCSTSTCESNPRAQCKPNYCGGCHAIWYEGSTIVDCSKKVCNRCENNCSPGETCCGCGNTGYCSTEPCREMCPAIFEPCPCKFQPRKDCQSGTVIPSARTPHICEQFCYDDPCLFSKECTECKSNPLCEHKTIIHKGLTYGQCMKSSNPTQEAKPFTCPSFAYIADAASDILTETLISPDSPALYMFPKYLDECINTFFVSNYVHCTSTVAIVAGLSSSSKVIMDIGCQNDQPESATRYSDDAFHAHIEGCLNPFFSNQKAEHQFSQTDLVFPEKQQFSTGVGLMVISQQQQPTDCRFGFPFFVVGIAAIALLLFLAVLRSFLI